MIAAAKARHERIHEPDLSRDELHNEERLEAVRRGSPDCLRNVAQPRAAFHATNGAK